MYGENEEENVILVSLNSSLLNDFLREHIKRTIVRTIKRDNFIYSS